MHVTRQGSFSPLCVSAVLDIPIVDCDVLEAAKKNIQLFASVSPASYKPADTADIIYVRSSSATSGISQGFLNEEIMLVGGPQIWDGGAGYFVRTGGRPLKQS